MFLKITHRKSLETSATKSLDKVKASWQMGLEMKLFIPQHCGIKFLKIVLCCNYLYIREVVLFKGTQVLKCSNNVDFPNVFEPMHTNTLIHYTNFSIFAYCAVAAQQWFCCYTCIPLCLLLYKSFQKRTFWRTPPDNITSYMLWSSSESKKCPTLSVAKSRDISYIY